MIALPHLGASTEEAEENCAVMVVDQVREYLENGTIVNAVNFPNVEMPRESPYRVAIANANVPNMLGQISTAMARAGLNIHNMVNKSRGEMAYTLVDVDSPDAARRHRRDLGDRRRAVGARDSDDRARLTGTSARRPPHTRGDSLRTIVGRRSGRAAPRRSGLGSARWLRPPRLLAVSNQTQTELGGRIDRFGPVVRAERAEHCREVRLDRALG